MKGYTVKKIYVIICDKCNEDITRALSREDVETRTEADRAIREHEQTWHGDADPPQVLQSGLRAQDRPGWDDLVRESEQRGRRKPRTYGGPYCDSALAEYPPGTGPT